MRHADTIVAPITAIGGPVGTVRVSGPSSFEIASVIFDSLPAKVINRQAVYGKFTTGDDGLALPFLEGHGYTGEPSIEFSIHGSRASMHALLDACLRAGARMAEPGEFSLRAFLNGKIDLAQAEAVRDTVAAKTDRQLRFANAQRTGELTRTVAGVRDGCLKILASVEASVDFSEEIGEFNGQKGLEDLKLLELNILKLLESAEAGRIARSGLRIALIGPPNAGKSSLLNRLVGADRAIVTPIAGTTRDTIEEQVDIAGIPCVLIDTAGLRETDEQIEVLGVARSREAAAAADLVWYVHDATTALPEDLPPHDLLIFNKTDVVAGDGLRVSALTGEGVSNLTAWLEQRYRLNTWDVLIDPRHCPPLTEALEAVRQAQMTIQHDLPHDLLSVHLRAAAHELGTITGETASADMVERIFHDFCIGK